MEILIFFGIIFFAYVLFGKSRCDICDQGFGKRSIKHKRKVEGKKLVICSRCNRKLENRVSSEKFNQFFGNADTSDNNSSDSRRERIPSSVKREVWQRDKGKCVECGSNKNLEYDHIIPVSRGGANSFRNLQLLCEKCNRRKSANIQ